MPEPEASDYLPVIVDTPTSRPRLGFEKYVRGVSAAIMGGRPARYTVGLYGPWGSGKSSLLTAIRKELHQWPERTGQDDIAAEPSAESPIVVEFDAWRYADKGSLVLSVLLRIEAAVERRSQLESVDSVVRQGLFKTLGLLKSAVQSVDISIWGVSLSANIPPGSSERITGRNPQASSALMPFDKLQEIGEALPDNQRVVVLIDDLDRCSPDGIVSVLEAMHVLTDITGIVFVMALDYEYLSNAIEKAYPTADPDRFIEKIIQVPFHIPAPKVEDADMSHIIPTWADIGPWVEGIEIKEIRAIMRIGLRSNPRQIKRLFNTYLLFSHINYSHIVGAADAGGFDKLLTLKVLGLQVAWPGVFAEMLRELSKVSLGTVSHADQKMETIGRLDSYSSWLEDGDDVYPAEESVPGDSEGISENGASGRAGSRTSENGRTFTLESRERLRSYFEEVLTHDISSRDVKDIMVMAQVLTQSQDERSSTQSKAVNRLQESLDKADYSLVQKYRSIVNFVKSFKNSDSTELPSYYRISCNVKGRTRVFGIMRVRPTQGTVRLWIKFGSTPFEEVKLQGFPKEFVATLEDKGGPLELEGVYVVNNLDSPSVDDDLKRILEFAHERCLASLS